MRPLRAAGKQTLSPGEMQPQAAQESRAPQAHRSSGPASRNKLLRTRRTSKARWATLSESTGREPEAQFAVEIGLDLI